MKKLSFILALVLVLSCVLVACGDETEASSTPETESSVAADASSEAATEESSEAATEESSEAAVEESSEAATEESTEESETGTIVTGGNVAAGRPYTISGNGKPGGNYTANLTDGVAGDDVSAYNDTWFAFYSHPTMDPSNLNAPEGKGYVIIDLGEKKDLTKVRIHCGNQAPSGVNSPLWFDVKISDSADVDSFEYVAEVPVKDSAEAGNATLAYWAEVDINTSGRYVMISVQANGTWTWINEIEIYDAQ
ncbi:MAG: hypothetical protein IKU30_03975 [Clostridia bacterium]|nr:hypothetical protein [Clostridia bacterium]